MDDPRPWVRLKNEIIRMIEAGVLEPGDEVPITLEAADFGLKTFAPAKKAFDALVAEGWLLPAVVSRPYRVAPRPADPSVPAHHP